MAAPILPVIAPELFQKYAGKNGKMSADEAKRAGIPAPPKGQQYTYNFKNPSQPISLKKDGNELLGKLGDIAKVAVPIVLAATGVGAPAAAAIMAGTYAADKKADGGSWGDAAKAGAFGGAAGYIGAGGISSSGGKVAANAALGGAQGASDGGGMKGAILGAAGGAAGSAMAGNAAAGSTNMAGSNAWGDVLKSLAKDPETYKAIAAVAGNAGKGAAAERAGQNNFATDQGRTETQRYGTEQNALAELQALQEKATMERAKFAQTSRSSNAKQALLGSLLSNAQNIRYQPPPGVKMAGGGMDLSALLSGARQAGRDLSSQATIALQTGSDVPGATDYAKTGMVAKPTAPTYQSAGKMESALSNSGLLASLLASVAQKRSAGSAPPKTTPGFEQF